MFQETNSSQQTCGRAVVCDEFVVGETADQSGAWTEERQSAMLARQREEILRHKWIESEKAQRDLGADAVLDWIRRYAAEWRKWYESEGELKKA
jgi:hypothetical protein